MKAYPAGARYVRYAILTASFIALSAPAPPSMKKCCGNSLDDPAAHALMASHIRRPVSGNRMTVRTLLCTIRSASVPKSIASVESAEQHGLHVVAKGLQMFNRHFGHCSDRGIIERDALKPSDTLEAMLLGLEAADPSMICPLLRPNNFATPTAGTTLWRLNDPGSTLLTSSNQLTLQSHPDDKPRAPPR